MKPSHTLFLERFMSIDFAYVQNNGELSAESVFVTVGLSGNLDTNGFVIDFSDAKKTIKKAIDDSIDHKCLIPLGQKINYQAPTTAIVYFPQKEITLLNLENYLTTIVKDILPQSISKVEIHLEAEKLFSTEPNFCYLHGLKHHYGNCQRLLHGHRNFIKVLKNKVRQTEIEKKLCIFFNGKHFVAKENIIKIFNDIAFIEYTGNQGRFCAEIPVNNIIQLNNEPSIENIASFVWQNILNDFAINENELEIILYEGLHKGVQLQF